MPDVKIPADHGDAANPRLGAVASALSHRGAEVVIDADGENLVRRHRDRPGVQVCAQGLPNLLHELVHVVLAGVLDDDHGIDYGAIPFDLSSPAGRAVMFDELACCVLSCAYIADVREGESEADTAARVDAWFAEQVGIQPVFYGMEDDPAGFWRRVGELARVHATELDGVIDRAYRDVAALLAAAGADPTLCEPPRRLSFFTLWSRAAVGAAA